MAFDKVINVLGHVVSRSAVNRDTSHTPENPES